MDVGEKELDTLFFLQVNDAEKKGIRCNKEEIECLKWLDDEELSSFIASDRNLITPWFRAIYNEYKPLYKVMSTLDIPSTLPVLRAGNVSFERADSGDDHLLQLPFSYLCSNPGKSIRSMLCSAYAQVDTSISASHVDSISQIVERIHAASLLHDDIEDKSTTRRGAPCAHIVFGVARVINTGCFNYLKAMQFIEEAFKGLPMEKRYRITQLTLDTLATLHRAQGADINWAESDFVPTKQQYVQMIDGKTGALFKLCALIGGVCSDQEMSQVVADEFKGKSTFNLPLDLLLHASP